MLHWHSVWLPQLPIDNPLNPLTPPLLTDSPLYPLTPSYNTLTSTTTDWSLPHLLIPTLSTDTIHNSLTPIYNSLTLRTTHRQCQYDIPITQRHPPQPIDTPQPTISPHNLPTHLTTYSQPLQPTDTPHYLLSATTTYWHPLQPNDTPQPTDTPHYLLSAPHPGPIANSLVIIWYPLVNCTSPMLSYYVIDGCYCTTVCGIVIIIITLLHNRWWYTHQRDPI